MSLFGNRPYVSFDMEPLPLRAPVPPLTSAQAIHVFDVELEHIQKEIKDFQLSEEELRRAAQYKIEAVRNRFIVRRGILRLLLSGYAGRTEITIEDSPQGKPQLQTELVSGRLEFSITGSDDRALFVFALNRRVGIDMENLTKPIDCIGIARQFFTHREAAIIERLSPEEQKTAFFTCWTRKEAYIKAYGVRALDSFDTGITTEVFQDLSDPGQNDRWTFIELPIGEGWISCLAWERSSGELPVEVTLRRIVN